ncbi:hypothetical protein WT25_24415 [Burkholderia territorii]|nr:hypothetical protein WT25_24415 [Burkholderia territorii]
MAGVHAQAQTVAFSSGADAISGTVTKKVLSNCPVLTSTTTIAPVDQSTTSTSGSDDTPEAKASQTIYGVEVYNLSGVDDSTSASNTAAAEFGKAEAKTTKASLLQGLVTWTANDDPLTCAYSSQKANCTSTQTTSGLAINGAMVPADTYPAGTSFDVAGTINDPQCLGKSTFKGTLAAQSSTQQTTASGGSLEVTGLRLTGQATCIVAGLVPFSTTDYDLKVSRARAGVQGRLPDPNMHVSELKFIVNSDVPPQ